ncbi:metal ABC transporter ATP-binding protein [Pectinatus brassicae]|uniref:Zinc transport system ATP-binding protein n=1 Tax=Pectinatus brassicae TaxID=862415 RepID=A0A840UEE3_9FIRM|nr:ATP-binding cassette domain-containing protein [Pectinatus brassicae]MBB5336081.1 zinc transport system ATP-binding protein [Pectinatus brassicae]
MLKIDHLYFSYNNVKNLLTDINFTLNDGEYISIIGSNGSGKSTLIRLILKLIEPTDGTINNTFKNMAYVPQRFNQLNIHFPITVREVLASYKKVRHNGCQDISEVLNLLNLKEKEQTLIGQLSGGQCQKVFIARALLGNPDLLVLDEPSNGIDVKSRDEIYELLANLNKSKKMSIICVEHNLQAAVKNSTLLYHIKKGHGHMCLPERYAQEYIKNDLGDIKC